MFSRALTVIGIGNYLRGDDSVALLLLQKIKNRLAQTTEVQLWEDKDALSITSELLEIQTPIVIVDCADMGLKAGEYRFFNASECNLSQHLDSISTHGFGFAEALALAQTLGFHQALYFFAVQPEQMELEQSLSLTLKTKLENIAQSLVQQIQQLEQAQNNDNQNSVNVKHTSL